jgi:arginyl-tRNA synthetase
MPFTSDGIPSTLATGSPLLCACEDALAAGDALRRAFAIEPRRHEDQHADLRLLFTERGWLQSPAGERLIDAFRAHPSVTDAARRKAAVLVRFDDALLARLERQLAVGHPTGMSTDILAGRAFTVGFVGPNTNKALHVGHLRNVFLGHALACALEAGGAAVRRHSLVGDIGRRVCEAIVGYTTRHADESPDELGIAGDRLVELCSRDFPRERGELAELDGLADPNVEEREPRGDSADAVMDAWLAGEERERELWARMREWVLAGHRQTLARLGVRMDGLDFESEGIERARALIAAGLERGVLEHEESGAVVYRTGRSEYTTMVLLRRDGVPTEYARLLGTYHRVFGAVVPDALYVEVAGDEWQQCTAALRDLLRLLPDGPHDDAYLWTFHGSLTVSGRKMGSRTGEVVWIDDLLDEVASGPGVLALEELAEGSVGPEEIADVLVRGTFLCAPTARPLAFSLQDLVEGRPGPGQTIAEAWCRARRAQLEEPPAQVAQVAQVARTLVVQSQLYPQALARAAEKLDAASLATYLLGLAEACLEAQQPGLAAAPVLGRVLSSLGFQVGGAEAGGDGVRAASMPAQQAS